MNVKTIAVVVILLAAAGGAVVWKTRGTPSTTRSLVTDYIDVQVTEFHNLGWLGATGHPASATIQLDDPDHPGSSLYPGGIVLREISDSSPLADAGCRLGDVLVRVGESYLPNKEDPTLDLIGLIEGEISAGKQEISLVRLRDGEVDRFSIPVTIPALEAGYPLDIQRFKTAGRQGLGFLSKAQRDDGSFDTESNSAVSRLAVTSLAGLAFLASGSTQSEGDFAANIDRCFGFVEANVAAGQEDDSAGEQTSVFAVSYALMFLAELSNTQQMNMAVMQALGESMGRLLSLQHEDGGWALGDDPDSQGYSDLTLATNQALMAMGMAERANVMGPNEPIEKACAFIKSRTGDGNVVTANVAGFDRRSEAGRSAGAAAALKSIGCSRYDSFLTQLVDYNVRLGKEIATGRSAVPLHILNTAILRRQIGGGSWGQFFEQFRILLVSLQRQDGSFAPIPNPSAAPLEFEEQFAGAAWRTAGYSLALLLQEEHVPLLLCKVDGLGTHKTRDSDGHTTSGEAPPTMATGGMQMPHGAMSFSADNPEELREMLEKMGMDSDQIDAMLSGEGLSGDGMSGSFQIMTIEAAPPDSAVAAEESDTDKAVPAEKDEDADSEPDDADGDSDDDGRPGVVLGVTDSAYSPSSLMTLRYQIRASSLRPLCACRSNVATKST